MSTVIYLANQLIQVLEGKAGSRKISADRYLTVDAPEGTVINGMVMDAERFVSFLKEYWKQQNLSAKDVILVSNSTKFVGQTIEMPCMSDQKTLQFIRREFADIDRNENKLYGFIRLAGGAKHMQRLYAESVPPELIRDYMEIFEAAGIRLRAIYSGESSIINLVGMTLAARYDTFMLQIAGSMTLSTVLFTNGMYTYYNSVRCFHEQGTEDYAQDLARSVSQIRQFMQAHQMERELERLVLAGIDPADVELYAQGIRGMGINTPVEIFTSGDSISGPAAADAQRFLFAASGFAGNGAGSNYIKVTQRRKKEKSVRTDRSGCAIIGITAAVMLAAWGGSAWYTAGRKNALQNVLDYNNSPLTQAQVSGYDELTERNSFLVGQYASIAGMNENLDTYPWMTSEIIQIIDRCAAAYDMSISITSCDADTGTTNMIVTTKTDDVQRINAFIRELRGQEVFYDIAYTGYSYQGGGSYSVSVTCTLAEAAGREAAE